MSEKNPQEGLTNPIQIKKKQGINLAIVVAVITIIFSVIYFVFDEEHTKEKQEQQQAEFASPLKHIDAESIVLEKTESRLEQAEKSATELKKQMEEISKDKNGGDVVKVLSNRIEELEKKLNNPVIQSTALKPRQIFIDGNTPSQFPSSAQFTQNDKPTEQSSIQTIREDVITQSSSQDALVVPTKNPQTYIPAGTFVKAIALGGADASAAVNAQSNPMPMLFRIIEEGTMPNNQKSHLKGCLATAAVVGDISSERGMIRLETLSCVNKDTKQIVDFAVEGTVFGPEGKNGVRGNPVWREGALLQRAFVAGSLAGLSGALSQKYTTTSVSPLGSTQTISGNDVFKYGAAQGASTAMNKLAEYNIQRAEQESVKYK